MAVRPLENLQPLRASDEFERRLAERGNALLLGQLARSLPHEINNPLSGVLGMLELLSQDVDPSSPEHELYGYAVAGCRQIRRVVDALSGFALEEAGNDQDVRVEETVAAAVELVRLTTAAKDVEIVERIDDGPWMVRGSQARLKQVFVALIVNAQDAMPEGGTVTLQLERDADWIVATVADTGPGINPSLLDEVFDPFMTTRTGRGRAGLGLSFARAVARAHGGELRPHADRASGACLELVLPAAV